MITLEKKKKKYKAISIVHRASYAFPPHFQPPSIELYFNDIFASDSSLLQFHKRVRIISVRET